jgi:hypothetical protein
MAVVEVLEYQSGGWFLLSEGDHHYLDVNCRLPLVDTSILLRLDEDEEAELRALGRTFVEYLAAKVSYWPDRYQERAMGGELAAEVNAAVARWRRVNGRM